MKKVTVLLIGSLVLITGVLVFSRWQTTAPDVKTVVADKDTPDIVSENTALQNDPDEQAVPEKSTPLNTGDDVSDTDQQLLAMGFTPEELAEKRRLLAVEQAADQRFDEAVQMDRLSADQVNTEVKQLMQTVNLEPVFDSGNGPEGFIDGLKIVELSNSNPLAAAGFKAGDKLTVINGQPLQDPAQIAYLFTTLESRFEVCADRDDGQYCRFVTIENG